MLSGSLRMSSQLWGKRLLNAYVLFISWGTQVPLGPGALWGSDPTRFHEVPRFRKVPKVQARVPSKGLQRFQVRVSSDVRVPSKRSGLRVLSKFQVKLPEGSKVPSKGSKPKMREVPRFQAKGFKWRFQASKGSRYSTLSNRGLRFWSGLFSLVASVEVEHSCWGFHMGLFYKMCWQNDLPQSPKTYPLSFPPLPPPYVAEVFFSEVFCLPRANRNAQSSRAF